MSTAAVGLFELTDAADPARLLAGISDYERERYRALERRPRRARQYLASRWLLRVHIGSQLDLQPLAVCLRDCPNGPPTVAYSDLQVGLSHSHGMCLCITSTQARTGCDIERHQGGRHFHAIATQYFHPEEAALLNAVPHDPTHPNFYRLWTLKEATQKARGLGIAGGMRSPAFVVEPTLRCLHAPSQGPWTFASSTLDAANNRYSLALAIAGTPAPARFVVREYTAEKTPADRKREPKWDIVTAD